MALRTRRAGGESKPPQAASVKSRGRERCGKVPTGSGQVSDEKTNMCEPLLTHRNAESWHQNRGRSVTLGQRRATGVPSAGELPVCGPGGVRCKGGVRSSQALAWNRRTCRPDSDGQSKWVWLARWSQEGGPQVADTARGRVPMRGTGADQPVVAKKGL